jgi:hypothetical protein
MRTAEMACSGGASRSGTVPWQAERTAMAAARRAAFLMEAMITLLCYGNKAVQ